MRKANATSGMTPAELLRCAQRRELGCAYVLAGDNTLVIEQLIGAIRAAVLTEETQEFNYEALDAESEGVTCAEIIAAIDTVPFMGGVRLVVVKHVEALPASEQEVLGEHVGKGVAAERRDVVAVLVCRELDKRTKFAKQMTGLGIVVECAAGSVTDPAQAAREQYGKVMSNGAAVMLKELCGGDARMLANEIEKVCLYVGTREQVTEEDVMAVCVDTALRNEWEVAERLLQGDAGKALQALRDMREGGVDAVYECTIVASAISRLPGARAAAKDGTLFKRWSEFRLSYNNPAHRVAERRVRGLSERQLAAALRWLMYMDIAVKGTNLPADILADVTCLGVA